MLILLRTSFEPSALAAKGSVLLSKRCRCVMPRFDKRLSPARALRQFPPLQTILHTGQENLLRQSLIYFLCMRNILLELFIFKPRNRYLQESNTRYNSVQRTISQRSAEILSIKQITEDPFRGQKRRSGRTLYGLRTDACAREAARNACLMRELDITF